MNLQDLELEDLVEQVEECGLCEILEMGGLDLCPVHRARARVVHHGP